jgi:hypothetical protein
MRPIPRTHFKPWPQHPRRSLAFLSAMIPGLFYSTMFPSPQRRQLFPVLSSAWVCRVWSWRAVDCSGGGAGSERLLLSLPDRLNRHFGRGLSNARLIFPSRHGGNIGGLFGLWSHDNLRWERYRPLSFQNLDGWPLLNFGIGSF